MRFNLKLSFFCFIVYHIFIVFKRLLIYVCYYIDITFLINSDNRKFAVTLISIRVLTQILFTHTYIKRNIVK